MCTFARDPSGIRELSTGISKVSSVNVKGRKHTVSNTASYLRLWALSLAHSQLAKVFWEKIMLPAIDSESGSVALIVVAFSVFAAVTFAVLLAMDVLECYLHALRLHWVEFQNKFYAADGHKFEPFAFRARANRVSVYPGTRAAQN